MSWELKREQELALFIEPPALRIGYITSSGVH